MDIKLNTNPVLALKNTTVDIKIIELHHEHKTDGENPDGYIVLDFMIGYVVLED